MSSRFTTLLFWYVIPLSENLTPSPVPEKKRYHYSLIFCAKLATYLKAILKFFIEQDTALFNFRFHKCGSMLNTYMFVVCQNQSCALVITFEPYFNWDMWSTNFTKGNGSNTLVPYQANFESSLVDCAIPFWFHVLLSTNKIGELSTICMSAGCTVSLPAIIIECTL